VRCQDWMAPDPWEWVPAQDGALGGVSALEAGVGGLGEWGPGGGVAGARPLDGGRDGEGALAEVSGGDAGPRPSPGGGIHLPGRRKWSGSRMRLRRSERSSSG